MVTQWVSEWVTKRLLEMLMHKKLGNQNLNRPMSSLMFVTSKFKLVVVVVVIFCCYIVASLLTVECSGVRAANWVENDSENKFWSEDLRLLYPAYSCKMKFYNHAIKNNIKFIQILFVFKIWIAENCRRVAIWNNWMVSYPKLLLSSACFIQPPLLDLSVHVHCSSKWIYSSVHQYSIVPIFIN